MKRFFCAILALLMLAALAGCSKSVSDEMLSYREESSNGFYSDMAGDYPESQEKPQESGEAAVNKKLIRTIYLEAETEDLAGLLQAVQQQVDAMEGYVESRNVYHGNGSSNDYRYADLVLRIPAERADGFCAYVEGESNIISSNEDVDDVTLSYVATESRVKALQTEEARLLELMEQAETMSDLLEIEARLTDVRYELETVTSQLRLYDNLVDYATIQLNVRQVQVLTPMRKGSLGVETLNPTLQKYMNPPAPNKKEHTFGSVTFREGDKVMQIKNNYDLEWEIVSRYGIPIDKGLGIFNGDMGRITEINEYASTLTVEYDEHRRVTYAFVQAEELEPAYAITVHKSQGSEYAAVVMPLLSGPKMLFNRNLLYTGVTRAKNCVTILGSSETVRQMINNAEVNRRYTALTERIKELS